MKDISKKGVMCVCFCLTLQRVWALEGEQPGSGERGQWRGSTPRSRVHAYHQTVGPQTHPRCHNREHHQEIWHTLSAFSYTRRYLIKADCSFTCMHFGRHFYLPKILDNSISANVNTRRFRVLTSVFDICELKKEITFFFLNATVVSHGRLHKHELQIHLLHKSTVLSAVFIYLFSMCIIHTTSLTQ